MRRRFKKVILTVVPVLLFAAVLVSGAVAGPKDVTIKSLDGLVDIKKGGTENWVPAEVGMLLTGGDTIRTTLDSVVVLGFDDGSIIRLNEETQLLIDDLSASVEKGRFLYFFDRNENAKKAKFKLKEGNIVASVNELPNSKSVFSVETPKGIAGVRGTNWEVGDNQLAVVTGFINWVPRSKLNRDGGSSLIADIRRFVSGGKSGEVSEDYTRINEGAIADIGKNGELENIRTMDADRADIVRDIAEREGLSSTTASQQDANQYFNQQAMSKQIIGQTDEAAKQQAEVAETGERRSSNPAPESHPTSSWEP